MLLGKLKSDLPIVNYNENYLTPLNFERKNAKEKAIFMKILYLCSRKQYFLVMTTFALNNLWTYLQGLSLSKKDREWLANKLIMPKETYLTEDDNARLDEALKKFSGDFGGSADAMTIAEELRQGAEMVKEVETW